MSDDSQKPSDSEGQPVKRRLPAWAILLAVLAFLIFNSFFALFAIQMGSGGGE